ncbi:MAG: Exodeoxyribonuclease [Candidatus Heimdallarchaeota archaeon LC_3]|nr:MAG: Exodeoxyribonuclease [Candidatus Heimdallarchaeota archaeon LC_3]
MISWNVNGIKSTIDQGLIEFVKKEDPDFLCLQEVKTHYKELDRLLPNYKSYWNPAERKGYSGTLIYTKIKPLKSKKGMGIAEHDTEGRITSLEFEKFYLITVYTVNAKRGLIRLDYRMRWDKDFLKFIIKLDKKKTVIVCGDLNVAHKEIDLAHPKRNKKNPGFTQQERDGFSAYLDSGFVDTFRHFDQSPEKYTWWSNFSNARERNVGWRLDYFLASNRLMNSVKKSEIMSEIYGSDHCPIKLEIEI